MGDTRTIAPLGRSGLRQWAGRIDQEWHPKLSGTKAIKVYTEMGDNDPIVGAILYLLTMFLQQVQWRVEAAGPSPAQQQAADLLRANLTPGAMTHTWSDCLSEALTMLQYGWALLEITYQRRADGTWGWREIALRGQESLDHWEIDPTGQILGMWQTPAPDYQPRFIPMGKAALFRTSKKLNNPEGRSLLRTAYTSWFFASKMRIIEGIGVERDLAGLPVIKAPLEVLDPSNLDPSAVSIRNNMARMVKQIRRDEQEGIVFPSDKDTDGKPTGYELSLLSTGGRRSLDVGAIIQRHETRIALTLLAQFLLLGTQAVGSYSLASSQTNTFAVALGGMLKILTETIEAQLVGPLMDLNAVRPDDRARLVPGDLEAPNLKELADALNTLTGAQLLTPDPGLEDYLRRLAGLPAKEKKA